MAIQVGDELGNETVACLDPLEMIEMSFEVARKIRGEEEEEDGAEASPFGCEAVAMAEELPSMIQ